MIGPDSEETATTAALMVEVTTVPEFTVIGVPAVEVGIELLASTPAPTSVMRIV